VVASPDAAWAANPAFRITTLSNRPDKVSGGDVLVRIDVPESLALEQAVVNLNGQDITSFFRRAGAERALIGLVVGLKMGQNRLDVFAEGQGEGTPKEQLALTNHPIKGPVFSGPQEQPFLCSTERFKLPDGMALGPPLDADCSVKTVVNYVYKAAPGEGDAPPQGKPVLKPLPSLTALPPDVAWTVTSTGQRVPYVVRIETGTINRAIYQIAILHDPSSDAEPGPLAPPKGWNRRLVYTFGGGCPGGWYKQGVTLGLSGGVVDDATIGKGYAEASATLNVFGNNCSDLIAAETMMMVKERFIEAYGRPLFTMGQGGSGGSYQQIQIADNYPGLLDGIMPSSTFPDVLATIQMLTDFQLLNNYYTQRPDAFTDEQKRAVAGAGEFTSIAVGAAQARRINPMVFCPPDLPQSKRYDPVNNPGGARCDVFDHTVNVYGRDPATGFARRPIDNLGVQYGLAALNAGTINATQFLDLNEKIGGYDHDGNLVATRAVADLLALRAAYQTGRLTHGGGGLSRVPILDLRGYRDQAPAGDMHLKFHSFSFRERLRRANGTVANEVLLVGGASFSGLAQYGLEKMDEWLTSLEKDTSSDRQLDKIVRAKPVDLVDSCYKPGGERIAEPQIFGAGQCSAIFPDFPSPRMIAGGPAANNVLKCRLKPVDFTDYTAPFTDAEKKRLANIFPDGVCDWTKPGVEQQPPAGSWLSF
jgi:hypothetical protein